MQYEWKILPLNGMGGIKATSEYPYDDEPVAIADGEAMMKKLQLTKNSYYLLVIPIEEIVGNVVFDVDDWDDEEWDNY